ncbi:uncharacterized protein LOC131928508 [Physella acuta]|uniref:uncharacterized protein LOC131928508 n=1 Tax=Physella acuta TaxID=109671 RepID=UPI0027DC21E8|nr:uncharacterized protein LOC131928508 [Physella acuta]XP_059140558.1 uncharacterized protein LOC131928508 [Physella acuta]
MTTNGESTEISCLATNAFSWQSKVASATPERKVKITQRKEEPDTNIISIIILIVIAAMIIISLLVCWKTGLNKKLLCSSQTRVEGPGCQESIALRSKELDKLCVLTLGRLGSGKSATCNLILGRPRFKESANTTPKTTKFKSATTQVQGRELTLFDNPGLSFKDSYGKKLLEFMHEALYALSLLLHRENPNGFNALIYVFKYASKFNPDDKTLLAFQETMETDFLRKYGIVVVTNIHKLDTDEYKSVKEWCDGQTGGFKELVEACQNRVVFVNNKEKDADERERMRNKIIEMIIEISKSHAPFNRDATQSTISMHVRNMFRHIYKYFSR